MRINNERNEEEKRAEIMLEKALLSSETPPLPDFFESKLMTKARLLMEQKSNSPGFWNTTLIILKDIWVFFTVESRPILATALLLGFLIGNQLTDTYTDPEFNDDYTEEFEIASRLDYFTATPVQSIHHFLLSGDYDETE